MINFALIAIVVLSFVFSPARQAAIARADDAVSKPNVLYILADDLGYGDVSCFNLKSKIQTPNMDRLSSQGMMFTDAHSGSSVCTPTRYGVLTGRYAWRTRLQRGVLRFGEPLIREDRLTVAKLFQQQGYHAAGLGKWHLGFQYEWPANEPDRSKVSVQSGYKSLPPGCNIVAGPITRGFDSYYWFKIYNAPSGKKKIWAPIDNDVMTKRIPEEALLPELTRRGVDYIAQRGKEAKTGGKPFFLYWAPPVPHTPIAPIEKWQGRSKLTPYADYVMQLDASVGELMKALKDAGLADNTLVMFASDNGSPRKENARQLKKKGHDISGPYRGGKADIWDGGHRIPLIARWPGKIKAGSRSDQLICLTDFMSTAADILGVDLPDDAAEDSISMLPVLQGRANGTLREAVVHHSYKGYFAIRQDRWKLAFCLGSGGWSHPTEEQAKKQRRPRRQLYDMEQDRAETKNLQKTHPEIVQRLATLMRKYVKDGRSTPGVQQKNDVTVEVKHLPRSLAAKESLNHKSNP